MSRPKPGMIRAGVIASVIVTVLNGPGLAPCPAGPPVPLNPRQPVPVSGFLFSPARLWADGIASTPRLPLAGDADGDGLDDILALYPTGSGIIDFVRTSPLGKPCFSTQARTHFGADGIAAVCGRFTGRPGAEVCTLFADGSVRVAYDMAPGSHTFSQESVAARLPPHTKLRHPVRAVCADFDADGRPDIALVDSGGRILLLRNDTMAHNAPHFRIYPVSQRITRPEEVAAGLLGTGGTASIVWRSASGQVSRARFVLSGEATARLERPIRLAMEMGHLHIAVGRFRGGDGDDLIVGQRLFPRGSPVGSVTVAGLPTPDEQKGDVAWMAADLNGDGLDDLVRVRRSGARFVGDDLLAHFALRDRNADWPRSSSGDGLLDSWKMGKVKPGGLDLSALGCKVGHYDVIVEIQRTLAVKEAPMRAELERAVRYFASLPVTDPDGSRGIALHVIYREPIPAGEESKPWWELGDLHHPASHRGITHYMVVSDAGGGQSSQMGDRGGCGAHALYATFLHEFGHQLGLDHTGFWGPGWCPLYPSMMNYAYSYQLDGKPENIGYSDGSLASVVLDERHLSERLPFPMSKIKFLAGPPYHYRLKPAPDGSGTLVDWNWNGIFGEENVAADINYGYSTTGGLRHTIGKTYTAPAPVVIGRGRGARLIVIFGRLAEEAPRPPADATAAKPGVSPEQPGRLLLRAWQGQHRDRDGDRWSDEQTLVPDGLTGDPSAASLARKAWIAYPTAAGVQILPVELDPTGKVRAGPVEDIPDTVGAQPTVAAVAGKLALFLWRDRSRPVGARFLSPSTNPAKSHSPPRLSEEIALDIRSNAPVGAAGGALDGGRPTLWIGFSQDQDSSRLSRWRVERLRMTVGSVKDPAGALALEPISREWIGGEKGGERGASRVTLLWERAGPGKEGQLFFLSNGALGSGRPWSCHYVSTRIADRSVNGGWLTRRYYDEWTESRSAPGVCFFRGDIVLSVRWFGDVHGWDNDNLFVAFHGRGIEAEKMGDFDDIGLIRDVGMAHSIVDVSD